jgi:hypothetical protein
MTIAAMMDTPNSRVQLAITGVPTLNNLPVYVERQISGGAWTFVRNGAPNIPNATSFNLNDYEFVPNVVNTYRARTDSLYDTFVRTSTSTWGTSDSGDPYTSTGGTSTDFNVAAGTGKHTQSTQNAVRASVATVSVDNESFADVGVSAAVIGASLWGGLITRYQNSNNYYWAQLEFAVGGALKLTLNKLLAGVQTVLGTATIGAYVVGNYYRIHLKVVGTSLFCTAWDNTAGSEPNAWTLTVSDSSLSPGNQVGAFSFAGTGNTNTTATVNFQSYHVADLSAPSPTFSSLGTTTITPAQAVPYLKFPLRPFLNQQVTLCNWQDETRTERGAVFQVLGRSLPVAVTELRESRTFTALLVAQDSAAVDALILAFSFGDIAFIQTPGPALYCGLMRRSFPASGYFFVGGIVISRPLDGSPTYTVSIPLTEVSAPDYSILGSGATWAGIEAAFSSWTAVEAQFASWNAVLQYVSSASQEIVG